MGRSGRPRVSVVIPTRNEVRNVEELLPAVAAVSPVVREVIVADCGSVDGTADTARRVLPTVKVVTQTRTGKGNALACGFAAATGDIIVTFDAHGAADPGEIPMFVAALVTGADVVTGSRFLTGGGPTGGALRRQRAALLNGVAGAFFGARQTDLCFGYHAFWAELLPALDLPPIAEPAAVAPWGDGPEIDTLLSCRFAGAGHRLTEVASVERLPADGRRARRSIADDRRVLRAMTTERRRARRQRRTRGEIDLLPIPGPREG